jgi:hypothetical protein
MVKQTDESPLNSGKQTAFQRIDGTTDKVSDSGVLIRPMWEQSHADHE